MLSLPLSPSPAARRRRLALAWTMSAGTVVALAALFATFHPFDDSDFAHDMGEVLLAKQLDAAADAQVLRSLLGAPVSEGGALEQLVATTSHIAQDGADESYEARAQLVAARVALREASEEKARLGRMLMAKTLPPDETADALNRFSAVPTGAAANRIAALLSHEQQEADAARQIFDVVLVIFAGALVLLLTVAAIKLVRARRELKANYESLEQTVRERTRELAEARDAADAANRAKSDFLANMSHEIRTPMNAVLGLAHLLQKTSLDPRQQDFVAKIDHAGKHLLGVINEILDFSKIEAGKVELDEEEFELTYVFDTLTTMVADKSAAKGLELVVDLDPAIPRVAGDRLRLNQVLTNLTANAVKFTHHGEIVLSAALEQERDDGVVMLRFTVRDTGIGMTAAQLARLFQSFHQADSSITREYGGTGLGLAISKQLVTLMGGEIGVDSLPGRGTTFWFTLPMKMAPRAPAAEAARLTGRRALVVDDNDVARTVLLAMVQELGMEGVGTSSGAGAIQAVERAAAEGCPFDVVYMDWKMPGLDGLEAARRIRALGLHEAPVILMVTAYDRQDLMRVGGGVVERDVLFKPVTTSALLQSSVAALRETSPVAPVPVMAPDVEADGVAGARVLLVEDNDINQIVAREILQDSGCEVDVADNGLIAVEMVQARAYDIVLMDMQMPVMDGLQASAEIRRLGRFATLPIVALTANALEADRKRCFDAGMNAYVSKPLDPEELLRTIASLVRAQPVGA